MRRKLGSPLCWKSLRVLTRHFKIHFSPARRTRATGRRPSVGFCRSDHHHRELLCGVDSSFHSALLSAFPGEFKLGSGEKEVRHKEAKRTVKRLVTARKRSSRLSLAPSTVFSSGNICGAPHKQPHPPLPSVSPERSCAGRLMASSCLAAEHHPIWRGCVIHMGGGAVV